MRRRGPPSWLGTLIVALATAAICLYTAAQLRRAVTPPDPDGAASTSPPR